MGVYIKGMEMPKNCLECVFYRRTDPVYDYCCISTVVPKGYIPEDCPLVEEKTGKWIYEGKRGRFPVCRCSVCGNEENADWAILGNNVNYCPHCGSRMVD